MFWKALAYSIRVWATSVLVSPIIYCIIGFYRRPEGHQAVMDSIEMAIPFYLLFIIIETALSSVTWVVFTAIIWLVLDIITAEVWLKPIIFLSGMLLTIATFVLIFKTDLTHTDDFFFIMMLCNSTTIAWACWFYDLKTKEKQLNTDYIDKSAHNEQENAFADDTDSDTDLLH